MTTEDEARIAARYPKRSPIDFVVGIALAAGIIGMAVLVVITGIERSNPPVVAMIRDFEVLDASTIRTKLVVQREDPSAEAECRIFAQAETFETVGETVAVIPPGDDLLTTFNLRLATVKEATSVSVEGCRLTG